MNEMGTHCTDEYEAKMQADDLEKQILLKILNFSMVLGVVF